MGGRKTTFDVFGGVVDMGKCLSVGLFGGFAFCGLVMLAGKGLAAAFEECRNDRSGLPRGYRSGQRCRREFPDKIEPNEILIRFRD